MASRLLPAVLAPALCLAACQQAAPPQIVVPVPVVEVREETARLIEARVPRNATLASLLRAHQVSEEIVTHLVNAARSGFDLRRMKAEQPYRLELGLDGVVREFTYQIDADRFLKVVGITRPDQPDEAPPTFEAQVLPYEKHRALVAIRGEVSPAAPSLIAAVNAAGEGISLALELARIFEGDIDFSNELQPGDNFEIVFEKLVREGEFAGYGAIHAAQVTNSGETFEAYRYQVPGQDPDYYDSKGHSLRRFFLKSPLKFEPRVTSGFSYRRLHPVLKTVRAHRGVDYGAPTGAPVLSVSSGTVVRAGWISGGGNSVFIRHANSYESRYLHLSAIAPGIRPGARVGQGETIGKVGATGLATGPHLHYELLRGGTHVNPLQEHRNMPPGLPIPGTHLATYLTHRARTELRFAGAVDQPTGTLAFAAIDAQDLGDD
jgi:murein DD-endopeptidase MepM/ murein hydrolase activator NlpD